MDGISGVRRDLYDSIGGDWTSAPTRLQEMDLTIEKELAGDRVPCLIRQVGT